MCQTRSIRQRTLLDSVRAVYPLVNYAADVCFSTPAVCTLGVEFFRKLGIHTHTRTPSAAMGPSKK